MLVAIWIKNKNKIKPFFLHNIKYSMHIYNNRCIGSKYINGKKYICLKSRNQRFGEKNMQTIIFKVCSCVERA